jgi:hypothetical protein
MLRVPTGRYGRFNFRQCRRHKRGQGFPYGVSADQY